MKIDLERIRKVQEQRQHQIERLERQLAALRGEPGDD